ncbi:hypothetical protein CP10743SC13_2418, partial [Chlamydia psittaci 10_743_SC13]
MGIWGPSIGLGVLYGVLESLHRIWGPLWGFGVSMGFCGPLWGF